jgi:5-oxoprolinase (ATP-hydrolysing) subunit A
MTHKLDTFDMKTPFAPEAGSADFSRHVLHTRTARIELNCDLGESFGAWRMGADAAVMPWISSVNIACGFHAGDPQIMLATLQQAKAHGLAMGAHTGLADLRGFGRREIAITPSELYADTLYQLGALQALAKPLGVTIRHIKPHGALYHMLEQQPRLAESFVRAAQDFSRCLIVVGLAQGQLLQRALHANCPVQHEAFADRAYQSSGALVPRSAQGAVIADPTLAAQQVLSIVQHSRVSAIDGGVLQLHADTICIHGDRTDAANFTEALVLALRAANIVVGADYQGSKS